MRSESALPTDKARNRVRTFQLRTYRLRTEEAAIAYLPHWLLHIDSLKLFGVETHAFFSSPSDRRIVLALISFAQGADAQVVTRDYMQSDAFKVDMTGFDVAQIEGVETLLLTPGDGSPLI